MQKMRKEQAPFDTYEQRDRAMADFLSDFCYLREGSLARASQLASGFIHIYPEHKCRMPSKMAMGHRSKLAVERKSCVPTCKHEQWA